jgi:hypothetical protein
MGGVCLPFSGSGREWQAAEDGHRLGCREEKRKVFGYVCPRVWPPEWLTPGMGVWYGAFLYGAAHLCFFFGSD